MTLIFPRWKFDCVCSSADSSLRWKPKQEIGGRKCPFPFLQLTVYLEWRKTCLGLNEWTYSFSVPNQHIWQGFSFVPAGLRHWPICKDTAFLLRINKLWAHTFSFPRRVSKPQSLWQWGSCQQKGMNVLICISKRELEFMFHHWLSMYCWRIPFPFLCLTILHNIRQCNSRGPLQSVLLSWQALCSVLRAVGFFPLKQEFSVLWIIFFCSWFPMSYCSELLWQTECLPVAFPILGIHSFFCFPYTNQMFSWRLMAICRWQTLSVFSFGDLKQKFQFCQCSQFKKAASFFFLNWKESYQHTHSIAASKGEWIWRTRSHFSIISMLHQADTKLYHLIVPSHILLLLNVLPVSPFLIARRNGKWLFTANLDDYSGVN